MTHATTTIKGIALHRFSLLMAALSAFAANSVLTRMAIEQYGMGSAGFTTLRTISAAAALWLLTVNAPLRQEFSTDSWRRIDNRSWHQPVALVVYLLGFTYAYEHLNTATGALILFATVQLTMICHASMQGERMPRPVAIGACVASVGLVQLLVPAGSAPTLIGLGSMVLAGMGWGAYCILGRTSHQPLQDTKRNFLLAAPMVALISSPALTQEQLSAGGTVLALLSGAVASAVGYSIWYAVLPKLTTQQAGVTQLAVPLLAALGGTVLLGESLTTQLVTAAAFICIGLAMAVSIRVDHEPELPRQDVGTRC